MPRESWSGGICALDIIADAYRQLSPKVRLALLKSFSRLVVEAPSTLAAVTFDPETRHNLEACLELIAVLADESASTLVKLALEDYGLDGNALAAYAGRHDRAADLWIRDKTHAKQVLRWWYANAEIRRRDRIEAFQTPRIETLDIPDKAGEARLRALIEQVLLEALQANDIRDFTISLPTLRASDIRKP